jgi:hypothetical protein
MSDHVTKIGTSYLTSEKHGLSLTESAMVHRASYSEKRLACFCWLLYGASLSVIHLGVVWPMCLCRPRPLAAVGALRRKLRFELKTSYVTAVKNIRSHAQR